MLTSPGPDSSRIRARRTQTPWWRSSVGCSDPSDSPSSSSSLWVSASSTTTPSRSMRRRLLASVPCAGPTGRPRIPATTYRRWQGAAGDGENTHGHGKVSKAATLRRIFRGIDDKVERGSRTLITALLLTVEAFTNSSTFQAVEPDLLTRMFYNFQFD